MDPQERKNTAAAPQKPLVSEVDALLLHVLSVVTETWLKRSLTHSTGGTEPSSERCCGAKRAKTKARSGVKRQQTLERCLGETPKSESWEKEGVLSR